MPEKRLETAENPDFQILENIADFFREHTGKTAQILKTDDKTDRVIAEMFLT